MGELVGEHPHGIPVGAAAVGRAAAASPAHLHMETEVWLSI